jgi:hypothetical protein
VTVASGGLERVFTKTDAAQNGRTLPTVETIITRMAEARADNQACFRPYNVTRDYKLFGKDREKIESEVVADIAFIPPDAKKYAIKQTSGTICLCLSGNSRCLCLEFDSRGFRLGRVPVSFSTHPSVGLYPLVVFGLRPQACLGLGLCFG